MAAITDYPDFPSFPTFPVEIQLKIWKLALLKPQIVHIYDANKHPDVLNEHF
jgi:hypothetical protein